MPITRRVNPRPRKEIDTSTYSGRFAVRLRELRDNAGLTTRELAELTGVPHSTIDAWDRGSNEPKIGQLPTLAEALGVTVRTLIPPK